MKRHRHKKQNQTAPKKSDTQPTAELTFLEHLYEIRKRLSWVVLTLIVVSAAGFQVKDQLIAAIMQPLHGQKLIYLTPGGGFSFIFTVSIYFGVLFTIPVAVYHLFRFLQPIIGKTSRRFITGFLIISTLLAASGALFGYFVTIPAALNFLATFAGDAVTPSLTAESYLSFVVTYIIGLALIFQLPLILFIFDHVRPFPPGRLGSAQQYVIIAATVLSAIITPTPDAFNMATVAIPVIFVYEIGVLAIVMRRRARTIKQKSIERSIAETLVPDEPLTEIIHELKQATVQPSSAPVLEEPVASTTAPLVVQNHTRQFARRMDGFHGGRQRPVTPRDAAPLRASAARSLANSPQSMERPRRSIDGFMPARANEA